ncbi:MAG: hypothetical protein F4Z36_07935 [Acidimicrobiia bacterium]|nr:hypothetical protein [Acidimicrobiia bacterium]
MISILVILMSGDDLPHSTIPTQTPFFRASEAPRYLRQEEIQKYEEETSRSLVVFWGPIPAEVVAPFADAVNDISPDSPLDFMLTSLGGNAEAAIHMAAMCHTERADFRVIVPDTAASAATLLALAAESVVMSNTSALGPVDPQIFMPQRKEYYPAKGILAIVDDLDNRTRRNPQAFELYASLLADVDSIAYQTAKDALARTEELIPEVLRLRTSPPNENQVRAITKALQSSAMHSATIRYTQAKELGIPTEYLPPHSEIWNLLWRLHAHYAYLLGPRPRNNLIEGRRVSLRFG